MNPFITAMIRRSGRSWWQCRYSSGKVLSEWDTMTTKFLWPLGNGKTSRWEEVSKDGMVGLRLLCPNGLAGELEAPEGHRFFQLKVGVAQVAMGFTGKIKGIGRSCDAHIIGVVLNGEGDCLCRAWEHKEKRLVQFQDNVHNMKYRDIGPLSLEVQGLKV